MRQLLVFAKAPRLGAVKTRLAAAIGAESACELYRAFLRDTVASLADLRDVRVEWWVDGEPDALGDILGDRWPVQQQPSGGLGGRLSFAFDAAFRRGRGPVGVIGTDCPLLTAGRIEALFERLGTDPSAALIPADDGGYVALGLSSPCPAAFAGIPWSTAEACGATLAALGASGRNTVVLEPLYDVDDADALERLAADLRGTPGVAPHSSAALLALEASRGLSSVSDALGRQVSLLPEPRRIVSLVPSMTECLFDAGLGGRVVGRTDYCTSPPEAAGLPSVGGPKTVDVNALLTLEPDLVLANAEENDRGQVGAIASAGVRVHVAFPKTLGDTAALLRDLGRLLHAEAPFLEFAGRLGRAMRLPQARGKVSCACLIWKSPYMTASGDTLTSALLEAAGAENVFATAAEFRYPSVSLGGIAAARPRVVLLPSEPYPFTEEDARELATALPGTTTLRIPGEWVTWYGSRMEAAILSLRRVLDPFR